MVKSFRRNTVICFGGTFGINLFEQKDHYKESAAARIKTSCAGEESGSTED